MALIGVRVGEYLLVEYIGSGGYGEVYVGRSEETMAEVAIKLELCGNRTPRLHKEYHLYKVSRILFKTSYQLSFFKPKNVTIFKAPKLKYCFQNK